MPADANVFKTTSTDAQYVNPDFWSQKLQKALRERVFMEQFARKDFRGVGKHNKRILIPKNSYETASTVSEGVEVPVSSLSYSQVEVTFETYAISYQVTEEELLSSFEFIMQDIVDRATYALAAAKEQKIMDVLVSGAGTVYYANGKDASSIDSSDTLDIDDIIELQRQMRLKNAYPKYLIVHPSQEAQMKKILVQNGSILLRDDVAEMKSNGYEIGRILGLKVYSSNFVKTAQEGASSDVDVAKAIMLADDAFVVAYQQPAKMVKGAPNARSLWIDITAYERYGVAVLEPNGIGVLVSAI